MHGDRQLLISVDSHDREFSYCHSLTGTKYHSIDQFRRVPSAYWDSSATCIAHLPQNKLEGLLNDEVQRSTVAEKSEVHFYRGYEALHHSYTTNDDISLTIRAVDSSPSSRIGTDNLSLTCRYLIGTDGANSSVRDTLGISLIGRASHYTTAVLST